MAVKIVTFWEVLIEKARRVGKAEQGNDPEELRLAKANLEDYKELVKISDELVLPGNPITCLYPEYSDMAKLIEFSNKSKKE